jgi:cytochrome c peroxidase
MKNLIWLCSLLMISTMLSCTQDDTEPSHFAPEFMEIPKGFDNIEFPEDNPFSQPRWELGKRLFYDPIMSLDSSISCASCHNSELAFSDDVSFSLGVENRLGTRNAPTLANVAYHPYFTREGGVPTLEMQILVPIQEHNEFDFNIVLLAERLKADSSYMLMSMEAYDREPDAFVITRSLACFERSLISGYSRYDHYENYDDLNALTSSEINGKELFFSDKTNCFQCHGGFNFTNYAFENNGLYEEYNDEGRFRLTGEEEDLARFKVPSLRNIQLTAPYMHDGSIQSLKDVIEHYNSGGENHPHKSSLIKPLNLTNKEKDDLLAFLYSLTDDSFVKNPLFKN